MLKYTASATIYTADAWMERTGGKSKLRLKINWMDYRHWHSAGQWTMMMLLFKAMHENILLGRSVMIILCIHKHKHADWANERMGLSIKKWKIGKVREPNERGKEWHKSYSNDTGICSFLHTKTVDLPFSLGMPTERREEKNAHKNNCLSFSCANVDVYYTWNTGTRSSRELRFPSLFTTCHCFIAPA